MFKFFLSGSTTFTIQFYVVLYNLLNTCQFSHVYKRTDFEHLYLMLGQNKNKKWKFCRTFTEYSGIGIKWHLKRKTNCCRSHQPIVNILGKISTFSDKLDPKAPYFFFNEMKWKEFWTGIVALFYALFFLCLGRWRKGVQTCSSEHKVRQKLAERNRIVTKCDYYKFEWYEIGRNCGCYTIFNRIRF